MPALSVIDNTPRDCPTPFCGAEADTSILVPAEAATMPVGRNSKGAVVAATMINTYMGGTGKHNFFKQPLVSHVESLFVGTKPQNHPAHCR